MTDKGAAASNYNDMHWSIGVAKHHLLLTSHRIGYRVTSSITLTNIPPSVPRRHCHHQNTSIPP